MQERRIEPRFPCDDPVDVRWKDTTGQNCKAIANLVNLSPSGACLQMDSPIPLETVLRIAHKNGSFHGRIRYCVCGEIGYALGVRFEPNSK
ncbi:MAG: PilZ domain-containing protein [Acidobacteria bacterium]|nr:PilZ domain-containing protein [Acidobacteriota bacterium]